MRAAALQVSSAPGSEGAGGWLTAMYVGVRRPAAFLLSNVYVDGQILRLDGVAAFRAEVDLSRQPEVRVERR